MKITFLGTRGYIDIRTRRHYRHTSTMIEYRGKRVMIDCGLDWEKKIFTVNPDAIVITHAHPDHAFGLKNGSPCPVYATKESWKVMHNFAIQKNQRHVMIPYKIVKIAGITFKTFPVVHSIRAPGVGYRITAGKHTIFCVHDLVYIEERKKALHGIDLYIGDGATIKRPMVRRKDDVLFGHTPISTQLTWCKKEDVANAIITHCGTQIVGADQRTVNAEVQALAHKRGVNLLIAHDGMQVVLE